MRRVRVIDSHTGGEPTRVVVAGGPELGVGTMASRLAAFKEEHDAFRRAVVNEPRGSDVLVGALLCEPIDSSCCAGVIFFNNTGYLGMCGHGMIGVVATLSFLGKIAPGTHRFETPVGIVSAVLREDGSVSLENVSSYRKGKDVRVAVPDVGTVQGDLAWGGNWFFLVKEHEEQLILANVERLTFFTHAIRLALNAQGFPEVDHIELFGPPQDGGNSRNFVLCPGKAYDRSPCGTGTSAKLACLAAEGELAEGEEWIQESIVGSALHGSFRWIDRERGVIAPTILGRAHIIAESDLLLDESDPFCWGIGASAPSV